MACVYHLSVFSDADQLSLMKLLSFTPTPQVKNKSFTPTVVPLHFFVKDEDTIRIPFKIATLFTKKYPNDHLHHSKLDVKSCLDLRDYQRSVCDGAEEIIRRSRTVTLALPPGFGKTILGATLVSRLGWKSVVLVPSLTLVGQWGETFKRTLPDASIWLVDTKKLPDESPDIIVSLDRRANKIPESWRKERGIMIIDEAHMMCSEIRIKPLLLFEPRYIIAETATPYRSDGMYAMMHSLVGKVEIKAPPRQGFRSIKINVPVLVDESPSPKGGVNYGALCASLSVNDEYNRSIVGVVMSNPHRKYIILTRLVDHARVLTDLLRAEGVTADYLTGSRREYQDSTVLIGTMTKIGVGFDEATASSTFAGRKSDTLILAHSIKQEGQLVQYLGRVMRSLNPLLLWIIPRNAICGRHYSGLKKAMIARGGVLDEIDYRSDRSVVLPGTVSDYVI